VTAPLLEGALYLLPALLIVLALALGRHPGERVIVELCARRAGRPRRRALTLTHRCAGTRPAPRGGRLIATALAGRAPPLALAAARGG
jgi:hypothetical protein